MRQLRDVSVNAVLTALPGPFGRMRDCTPRDAAPRRAARIATDANGR
jgi:hypothetical protein